MGCIETVRRWIDERHLIEPREKVVVAVSGGADSTALLAILAELARERGYELAVAHFEHGLRREASRERALVERRSAELGLPLFIGSGEVAGVSRAAKEGIEETGRRLRLAFLEETADSWGARSIALGHTRDDQVETILHHIIRGAGWRGLRGMAPRRGRLVHPLLPCTHAEIVGWLRGRGIRFAVDRSNRDVRFLRNRIRHRLLPYLRSRFNASVDEAIARLGENLSEGWASLERPLAALVPERGEDGSLRVAADRLGRLSDFELYLFTDIALRERFDVAQDVEKTHFDAVKRLVRSRRSGARTELPHGIVVLREHSTLVFERRGRAPLEPVETVITGPGSYPLPSWGLSIAIDRVRAPLGPVRSSHAEALVARVRFPLRVRTRRPGDRLVPFGMRGRRKLSDCLIDRKIPLSRRGRIPVLEDRGGILWVPGVVAAERTRVAPRARSAVRIRLLGMSAEKW